jgi:hypothetical protein
MVSATEVAAAEAYLATLPAPFLRALLDGIESQLHAATAQRDVLIAARLRLQNALTRCNIEA